jgi:hypothetical protein
MGLEDFKVFFNRHDFRTSDVALGLTLSVNFNTALLATFAKSRKRLILYH